MRAVRKSFGDNRNWNAHRSEMHSYVLKSQKVRSPLEGKERAWRLRPSPWASATFGLHACLLQRGRRAHSCRPVVHTARTGWRDRVPSPRGPFRAVRFASKAGGTETRPGSGPLCGRVRLLGSWGLGGRRIDGARRAGPRAPRAPPPASSP